MNQEQDIEKRDECVDPKCPWCEVEPHTHPISDEVTYDLVAYLREPGIGVKWGPPRFEEAAFIIEELRSQRDALLARVESLTARADRATKLIRDLVEALDAREVIMTGPLVFPPNAPAIFEDDEHVASESWLWTDEWLSYARSAIRALTHPTQAEGEKR